LAEKHTRQHVRDIWLPQLTHPRPLPDDGPLPDVRHRARAKFDRILSEHEPQPLEETAQAELQTILNAAARELGP
jgi:trimethylamine:corrinoid methyltransferase-like protein